MNNPKYCEYCVGHEDVAVRSKGSEFTVVRIVIDGDFISKQYMNFCPMCGRKLEVEEV